MTLVSSEWTWKKALDQAEARLKSRGIERLAQPEHEYKDLGTIEDIADVGDVHLANLLFRHQVWYSYVTVEMAYARASLASFDEIYDVFLGEAMHNTSKTQDSRVVKEVLKSISIQGNEPLKNWHRGKVEYMQSYTLLEGMVKSLEIRCKALESESIRRASTRRVERA